MNCWVLLSIMWEMECPSRGEGRSGCEVGGSGGGVLVMAGTGVGIMPPGRWHFRIKIGSLEMHLSGVRGE